ncbi:hypothetical protein HDU67_007583 [Dinochytrium kinnereticum]|nr:hypothetical protein HDU67_007583 [Dinochytrium kinnereticum]
MISPTTSDLYTTTPPAFGHSMRDLFLLDRRYTSLNHGSFGATPTPVFAHRASLLAAIEANPDQFYKFDFKLHIETALADIAAVLGVPVSDLTFVDNATAGVSAALRSFGPISRKRLEGVRGGRAGVKGRLKILQLSTVYHYVGLATEYTAHNEDVDLVTVPITYPISENDIIAKVTEAIEREERDGHLIVMAIFDAITSVPGVLLPLWSLIPLCKRHSIFTVVDAAHAIGQIPLTPLLTHTDPDLLVTNLHKWFYTPRGSALLFLSPRHHRLLRDPAPTPSPAIIAHPVLSDTASNPRDWKAGFMWTGTTDVTRYLAVREAVAFRRWVGGEERIMKYCHDLAVDGGRRVAEMWGTKVLLGVDGERTGGEGLFGSMVNVYVPEWVGGGEGELRDGVLSGVQGRLMREYFMSAQVFKHGGEWFVRFSAQIYNDLSDFEAVGKALLELFDSSRSASAAAAKL